MSDTNERLALLIDAENVSAKYAAAIVAKAAELGALTTKRAYGHFDNEKLKAWRDAKITALGIVLVSVPQTNTRKNSADFKLTIEAMDMLHTRALDGVCLASSDGDFSFLAERIRAGALSLYLFGDANTPSDYKILGHTPFIEIEGLATSRKRPPAPAEVPSRKAAKASAKATPPARTASRPANPILHEMEQRAIAAILKIQEGGEKASTQKISAKLGQPGRPFKPSDYGANGMKQFLSRIAGVTLRKGENETVAVLDPSKP